MSVYQKIINIQNRIKNIEKTGRNNHHGYNYVEADEIIKTIRTLMFDEGLLFIPNVIEATKEDNYAHVKMEFQLVDVDTGKRLVTNYYGEGKDSNDKAYYKAYTGALKYYFIQTFLIPMGHDPEATDYGTRKTEMQNKPQPKKMTKQDFIDKQKILWSKYNNGDLTGYDEWHRKVGQKYNFMEKRVLEVLEQKINERAKHSS